MATGLAGDKELDRAPGLFGAEASEAIHKPGFVLAGLGMVAVANMLRLLKR